MNTIFHLDLSDAHPGEDYWLHAGGRRHALTRHTDESRARFRAVAPRLNRVPDERLTHYTAEPVSLLGDRVCRVHVKHTMRTFPNAKGNTGVGNCAIHVPPSPEKLRELEASGQSFSQHIDYVTTAQALIFHHPDLMTIDPDLASIIYNYMENDQAINDLFNNLGTEMRQMGPPTEDSGWATLVPFTPPANPETGMTGTDTYYMQQVTDDIQVAAGPASTAMMKVTKNDPRLQGTKWTQQTGTSVATSNGQSQLNLASQVLASSDDDWQAALNHTGEVDGFTVEMSIVDPSKKQVKLTLTNYYIRYLGAYIRFYDVDGNAMKVPSWKPDTDTDSSVIIDVLGLQIQYDDLFYMGYLDPVDNVMAVPVDGAPGKLEVTVTFPEGAVSASVYGSSIGTGANPWPKTPLIGGVLTGLLNLGVPAFMLAFGTAAQAYKPLYDIIKELSSNKAFVTAVIGGGVGYFGYEFGSSAANGEMNWTAFSSLATLLFDTSAAKALAWVEAQIIEEEIVDAIPFAGWVMLAVHIATGIAQISETIVDVCTSPWNIENKISTTITTSVTVHPDPRHGAFPQAQPSDKISYEVKMFYKDQTRATVSQSHVVPNDSTATTLPAAFPQNTLGGQIKLEVDYYINNWLAGKATTGWIENDDEHAAQLDLWLVQYPVPLDKNSIYAHSALLTYQNGAYRFESTSAAPTATITSLNTSSGGNAISDWTGITLSQKQAMIGLAWKAAGMGITSVTNDQGGQLYAMMNLNIPGVPMDAVKFPSNGFDGQTTLIYDPYPPQFLMKDGQWVIGTDGQPEPDPEAKDLGSFYIDPRKSAVSVNEGGGYHLRRVVLDDSTPFNLSASQPSWGRFQFFPDSMTLHPSGLVIGISRQFNKIQVMQLAPEGEDDASVPLARVYAGEALNTDRQGLLYEPVAVTCSYDGTILILESEKSADTVIARIQAFDLHGNPVNCFADSKGNPTPFLQLADPGNNTYLDVAAVGDQKQTYIWVLFYTGTGASVSDYHMAIYQYGTAATTSNPLVTTSGVSAARLAVDMWYTVYTLNYAAVTDGQGNVAGPKDATTGPGGRTVPSISEWLPPVPS